MEIFIVAAVCLVIGILLGIFLRKMQSAAIQSTIVEKLRAAESEKAGWQQSVQQAVKEKQELLGELGQLTGRLQVTQQESQKLAEALQVQTNIAAAAKESHATMKARLEAGEEKLIVQKKELEEFTGVFRNEFHLLANGILDEKTRKFTQVNEENMKGLLDPLKVHLKEFKQKVEETYDKESKERFSLEKELKVLVELNKQLGEEANNLTHALKYNNKVQGNWGEMILESLLEHSGLTKGREYYVQEFLRDQAGNIIRDEEGKGMQPDITIVYPDQRKVIVDSKMSLVAYEQYTSANGPAEEEVALKEHLRSVRLHIDGLSRKNYPRYAGTALDYVVLFVPVEPAFLLAVREDHLLWKYAYDKRILLVSPTNLLAVLKIIADLWKVEKQSQHAIEIAEKAGALYDKFVLFTESMDLVGTHLQKAADAHGSAMKRLSGGNGNLVKQAEQLKKMGAKANKQLPDNLLKDAGEE